MARLHASGAGFDEQWIEDEVVVAIDENDVGVDAAKGFFETLSAIRACETAAEDDDAGATRGGCVGAADGD